MCSAPKPQAPAAPVPIPVDTTRPAVIDSMDPSRRKGRSRLTIPAPGASSTTGMSGLNIPT
jgi:hypothetical protein